MDPFVQKMADEIHAERLTQQRESERFVEEQRIRRAVAPRVWNELRDWLEQACINLLIGGRKLFEFEVWPGSEAKIRRLDIPCLLHVEFNADAHRIFYSCGAGRGEFLFRVNPDTTVVLETPHHQPYTIPEVGSYLLELLRKSQF